MEKGGLSKRGDTGVPAGVAGSVKKLYPMMIVPGLVQVLAAAVLSVMMRQLGLERHEAGMMQISYFAGMLAGTLLLTWMLQHLPVKKLALSQVGLLSAALLAAALSPWYGLTLFFYAMTGFANGVLVTLPGVYIAGTCGDAAPRFQNLVYGFFAAGLVLGPLVPAAVVRLEISWRWALVVPALLALPLAIPLAMGKLAELPEGERLSAGVIREVMSFNRSLFLGLLIGFLLYAAAHASVNTWMVSFLEEERGLVAGSAHLVLAGIALCITAGRWICGNAAKRIEPFRILFFITVATFVCVLVAPLPRSSWLNILLYLLAGLFVSGIYPFLLAYTAWFPVVESSAVVSVVMASGALGGLVFPYLGGLTIQELGPVMGMSSMSLLMIGLLACLFWIRPHIADVPAGEGAGKAGIESSGELIGV